MFKINLYAGTDYRASFQRRTDTVVDDLSDTTWKLYVRDAERSWTEEYQLERVGNTVYVHLDHDQTQAYRAHRRYNFDIECTWPSGEVTHELGGALYGN